MSSTVTDLQVVVETKSSHHLSSSESVSPDLRSDEQSSQPPIPAAAATATLKRPSKISNKPQQPQPTPNNNANTYNMQTIQNMTITQKDDLSRDLLQRICEIRDDRSKDLLREKYSLDDVRQIIQRDLILVEQSYTKMQSKSIHKSKGISLTDFIFIILMQSDIPAHETLYMIIAIIDFFEAVTKAGKSDPTRAHNNDKHTHYRNSATNGSDGTTSGASSGSLAAALSQSEGYILFKDITLFLCDNHPLNDCQLPLEVRIPTKAVPLPKMFNNDQQQRQLREIDINPPIVFRDSNSTLARLNNDKVHIDSAQHNNGMIQKCQYAESIDRLVVLDSFSDTFMLYSEDCSVRHKFRPFGLHIRGQACLDFFWSDRQMRIGSVFRDNYLAFWDYSDNFSFEKSFQIGEALLVEEQTRIWYITAIDQWVTTDNKTAISFWNLEKESVTAQIKSTLFSKGIISLVEIEYMKVVAIGSADNIISIWDFIGQKLLFKFQVHHQILNSLSYFRSSQVLLTGGYDSYICVYQLDAVHNDANRLGELIGHMSIVTAFKGIENTPMIVSSDDKHNVKIWDIRTCKCIQSIDVNLRSMIRAILSSPGRVYFQSSRLTAVEFDQNENSQLPVSTKPFAVEGIAPIGAVMNDKTQELVVCTTKDVRFFKANTGRLVKIISILVEDKDDGITSYQILQSFSRILIGTVKGALHIHDLRSGELLSTIPSHGGEVTNLRIDHANDLLFSAATDSSVLIQKITPTLSGQKYREIRNAHHGSEEILFAEVSVHHNIFITCSAEKVMLIWSYEFGRLLASYELEQDSEPVAVSIINGYSIIVVATTKGHIYFIKYTQDMENVDLELIADINIVKSLIFRGEALQKIVAKEVKRAYISQEMELRKLKNQTRKLMKEDAVALQHKQQLHQQSQSHLAQQSSTETAVTTSTGLIADKSNQTHSQVAATAAVSSGGGNSHHHHHHGPVKKHLSLGERLEKIKEQKSIEQRQTQIKEGLQAVKKIKGEHIDTTDLYEKDEVVVQGDDSSLFKLTKVVSPRLQGNASAAQLEGHQQSNEQESENQSSQSQTVVQKDSNIFVTQIAIDLVFDAGGKALDLQQAMNDQASSYTQSVQCTVIAAMNNGEIRKYDVSSIFKKPGIKLLPHCNAKSNYNAFRQNVEDHIGETGTNYKVQCFKQVKNSILKDVVVVNNLNKSKVIQKFQFSVLKIQQIRGLLSQEDDSYQPLDAFFNQSKNMIDLVQAHKGAVKSVDFLKNLRGQNTSIVSCGFDNCVKIWNFSSKIVLLAALNVTHPLPIRWDFSIDTREVFLSKLYLAIKSQETVLEKFKKSMSFQQYQKFNFRNLLTFIEKHSNEGELPVDGGGVGAFEKNRQANPPRLMKDEYTPRDLLFEKIKHHYQDELGGPSLKHLQQIKRVEASKKSSSSAVVSYVSNSEEYNQLIQTEEKNKETKFISAFLSPNYRQRFLNPSADFIFGPDRPKGSYILASKLDDVVNKKAKKNVTAAAAAAAVPVNNSSRSSSENQRNEVAESVKKSNVGNAMILSLQNQSQQQLAQLPMSTSQAIFASTFTNKTNNEQSIMKKSQLPVMSSESKSITKRDSLAPPIISQFNSTNNNADNQLDSSTNNPMIHSSISMAPAMNGAVPLAAQGSPEKQQLNLTRRSNESSLKPSGSLKSLKNIEKIHSKSVQSRALSTTPAGGINTYSGLKKEAEEIFNFRKEIPDTLEKKFISGAEFLIKINSIERNHGMKFQLFEPSPPPAGLVQSQSQQQLLLHPPIIATSRSSKTHRYPRTGPTATATDFLSSSSIQSDRLLPSSQGAQRGFLEYAQEKALINNQLKEIYTKQTSTLTPAQVKSYFLNEIEGETMKREFSAKFDSTLVSPPIQQAAATTKNKGFYSLNPSISHPVIGSVNSVDNMSSSRNQRKSSKIAIPSIPLHQQSSQQQQQKIMSASDLSQQQLGNATSRTRLSDFEENSSKQSVSSIINNQKQFFVATQRKCFQDVMKNMNTKLMNSKINHKSNSIFEDNSHNPFKTELPRLASTRYQSTKSQRDLKNTPFY